MKKQPLYNKNSMENKDDFLKIAKKTAKKSKTKVSSESLCGIIMKDGKVFMRVYKSEESQLEDALQRQIEKYPKNEMTLRVPYKISKRK